jgi:serine/threonine-protein kinase
MTGMIRFHALGPVDLRSAEGAALHSILAQPKRVALLAWLALARPRGFQRRDTVVALFWPELDDAHARAALSKAVHHLRRSLGEEAVPGRSAEELAVDPAQVWTDVVAFDEALERGDAEAALALYRGPLLDGFFLSEALEFERWVEAERARLAAGAARAAQILADARAREGRLDEAIALARRGMELKPDDEPALHRLLTLLDSSGDRAGAARAYDEFTRRLDAEYGVTASAETQALMESIRRRGTPNGQAVRPLPAITAAGADAGIGPVPAVPGIGAGSGAEGVARPAWEPTHAPAVSQPSAAAARPARRWPGRLASAAAVAAVTLSLYSPSSWFRAEDAGGLVVVPPLTNDTGDPGLGVVGRLAADWITQAIASSGVADVVDFRTALTGVDSGGVATAQAVGRLAQATRASITVVGAVYGSRDSLRLQAQLVRVSDGRVLGEPAVAAGPDTDPSALVDALAQRLVGGLAATADKRFTPIAARAVAPPRYDAYQAFTRGLELLAQGGKGSFDAFMDAARLDTTFAQAKLYALIGASGPVADSLIAALEAQRDFLTPYDRASLDRAFAERASDMTGWIRAARRAEELAPTSADAQMEHGRAAVITNPFAEAIETFHRRQPVRGWLEQSHLFFYWDLYAHHKAGDFEGELDEVQSSPYRIDFDPCKQNYLLRPLAALGREAVVDSILVSCESVPGAAYPAHIELVTGTEYSEHGHEAAARRAFQRMREFYERNGRFEAVSDVVAWMQRDWRTVLEGSRARYAAATGVIPPLFGRLGVAAAHLGEVALAEEVIARLEAFDRQSEPADGRATGAAVWAALVRAALGRKEEALWRLQETMDGRFPWWMLGREGLFSPGLDPLRGDPRFGALFGDRSRGA